MLNKKEQRMLEILKELKNDFNMVGVKAELEAEGTRKDEMIRLLEVTNRADMGIYIKIGGCEALSDLFECKLYGAKGIVAPMIESPFAMKKYVKMIDKVYTLEEQKYLTISFNLETITAFNNINQILDIGENKMTNISVGRVDFSNSLGIGRERINSDEMFNKVEIILNKAKNKKIVTVMGGGISVDAIPFIKKLGNKLDCFETRKIIFNNYENLDIKSAITLSTEFELLYLKNKADYYVRISEEDASRIKMMEERLNRLN